MTAEADNFESTGRPPGRPKGTASPRLGANTTFGHLVGACGLTHQDAADFLGISVQSVRAYASGATKTPTKIMDRIADLWERVSYRIEIRGPDLPEPARARREALQTVRMKTWRCEE